MTKNIVIYTRATSDAPSLELQRRELAEEAIDRDWDIADVYTDKNKQPLSALAENSKFLELYRVLDAQEPDKDRISCVMLWDPAHLVRNISEFMHLLLALHQTGNDVYTHHPKFLWESLQEKSFLSGCFDLVEFDDHIRRSREKQRKALMHKRGTNPGRSKISHSKEQHIIRLHRDGINKHQISLKVNVSRTAIDRVLREYRERQINRVKRGTKPLL